ncbi:MAG: PatB family C-S lyase, partial [Anaerohalosphaera sp.]|nr:PatB family C-S lyase [Anaerohalosphaera sp.]
MYAEYDFDKLIDRANSDSLKWNHYKGDVIPMWVADMDFECSPAVLNALRSRVYHGVFGYTLPPDGLTETIVGYVGEKFNWAIEAGWIVWLPGLVCGINVACRAYAQKDDSIVTFTPVYPPFLDAPGLVGAELVTVPMVRKQGRYTCDIEAFKAAITPATKLLLLCSPHNPVGRIFGRQELTELADVCLANDIVICSDEIHNGLLLDDAEFVSTATLSDQVASRTVTLMAPSKTFNVPGLGCSFAIIPEASLRSEFKCAAAGIVPHVNALGFAACLGAYRDSEEWHKQLLEYLRDNRDIVYEYVNNRMAPLKSDRVEATYLAWIDCRGLNVDDPVKFFEDAGVGLSDGKDFGMAGFVRLNFGCRRELLIKGLER